VNPCCAPTQGDYIQTTDKEIHMRIKNSFDAADLALCRAHGDAVGALVKASDVREPSAADYNLGLAGRLMELDAGKQPKKQAVTIVPSPSMAERADILSRLADSSSASQGDAYVIAKQTGPAAKQGQATHLVCVHGHKCHLGGEVINVGMIVTAPRKSHYEEMQHPECWLPCDKDGWVSHTPTAGSVCPVPVGVTAEAKWRKGLIACARTVGTWGSFHNATCEIVAWRPTGAAA
jgi:hypothetical protein